MFDTFNNAEVAQMASNRVSKIGFSSHQSYRKNVHKALDRFYTDGNLSKKQRNLLVEYLVLTGGKAE